MIKITSLSCIITCIFIFTLVLGSNGEGDNGLQYFKTDPDGGPLKWSQTVKLTWSFTARGCQNAAGISWCPLDGGLCKQLVTTSKFEYKWQASNDAIPGGRFRLSYFNLDDKCATAKYAYSNNFTTSYCNGVVINSGPKDMYVRQFGDPIEFSRVNATGSGLAYQWMFYLDGLMKPIPGATEPTFKIAAVTQEDLGDYSVVVTDRCNNSAQRTQGILRVCPSLNITDFSPFVYATIGQPLTVSISVSSTLAYNVFWFQGNSTKALSNKPYLYFEKFQASQYGQYVVKVNNSCPLGPEVRTFVISDKPFQISENPPSSVNMFVGDTFNLHVGVLSSGVTISYQWFKNNDPIPGATKTNYTIPPFSMLDNGATYKVSVSYGDYTLYTTPSIITAYPAPQIQSATASEGPVFLNETLTYSVSATGARLHYEWLINRQVDPTYSGQQSIQFIASSFALNSTQIIANVSNPNGFAVSKPFVLVIKPKPWFTVTSFPDLYLLRNEIAIINMTGLVLGEQLQFSWLQNGLPIASGGLTLPVQLNDSLAPSAYQMQASNPSGDTLSPIVHVYPEPAPKITGHSPSTFLFFPNDIPTLYINVTGRGVQYKWFENSQPINYGDTNLPEVTLEPLDKSDNGSIITAEAYNINFGSTFNFTYVLKPVPVITKQVPEEPEVYYFIGQTIVFSVEATGERLNFDWHIPPGLASQVTSTNNTSVLKVSNITQDFFVIPQVSNPSGVIIGKNISVELNKAPFIDQFPAQTVVLENKPYTFEARVRGDVTSYMWYIDDKLQPNNNSPHLTLDISTKYNSSVVKVVANNAAGTATTSTQLFVITIPRLTSPLESVYEALSDSSLNITVEATGYDVVYEWRRHNEWFMNTTIGQLSIAKTKTDDSGIYQLILHNAAGTAGPYQFEISIAALTINTPLASNIEVFAGDHVTLSVTLNTKLNQSDFVITWFLNQSIPISSVTGTTLDITNVTAKDSGQYSIVIRYTTSQVRAFVATVVILGAPVLQQPLQAPDVKSGHNATITALVTPELRLSYQWFKNGQKLEGEVGKTIQFEASLSMQGDRYSVLLSNPAGETKSNEVQVTVRLSDLQTGLIVGSVAIVVIAIVTVVTVVVRRQINQRRNMSFSRANYGVEEIRYPLLKPWTPPQNSKLCNVDKLPFTLSKTSIDFGAAESMTVGEEYLDTVAFEWRRGIGSTLASFKLKPNANVNESVPLMKVGGSNNPCVVVFHPPISPKCELVVEPRHLLVDSKQKSKKLINVEDGDNEQTVQIKLKMNLTTNVSALIGVELPQLDKHFYLSCNLVSSPSVWIDVDEIDKDPAPIGEGGFGVVYRGKYRGEDVAVKMLRAQEFVDDKTLEEFDREIHLLSTLKYEGIVPFVGASNLPGKLAIVTKFMPNGSLEKWMQKKIPFSTKLRIALEIAKAIQFLHKNNILHRDIKPENVLIESTDINSPLLIRLSDFGSARQIYEDKIESFTKNVGTPIYMAPEILQKKRYNKEADIYSYGILLWVLITQKDPYSAFNHIWDVTKFVLDGNREAIPAGCPSDYADLIRGCWQQEPSQRLPIQVVIDRLTTMYDSQF